MSREAHVPFYERLAVRFLRPTHRKEAGARNLGILQSLIATCRMQGIDPYTYLVDVLQRVNAHPMRRVQELTPRLWKDRFAGEAKPSLMEMVQEMRRAESRA